MSWPMVFACNIHRVKQKTKVSVRSCLSHRAAPSAVAKALQRDSRKIIFDAQPPLCFPMMMSQLPDPKPSYIFKWPACISEYLSFCRKACGCPFPGKTSASALEKLCQFVKANLFLSSKRLSLFTQCWLTHQ